MNIQQAINELEKINKVLVEEIESLRKDVEEIKKQMEEVKNWR